MTIGIFAFVSILIFLIVFVFTYGMADLYFTSVFKHSNSEVCKKSLIFKDSYRLFQKASSYYGSS